jgi:hypothetical protein
MPWCGIEEGPKEGPVGQHFGIGLSCDSAPSLGYDDLMTCLFSEESNASGCTVF